MKKKDKNVKGSDLGKVFLIGTVVFWLMGVSFASAQNVIRIPENGAQNINPDTHLKLTFTSVPSLVIQVLFVSMMPPIIAW